MDPIETLSTQESVDRKGTRFEPTGFTEEAAAVLSSILQNSQYECATRLPQAGGNRWYSEPIRLAKFVTGGVNCWKDRPGRISIRLCSTGRKVPRQQYYLIYFSSIGMLRWIGSVPL